MSKVIFFTYEKENLPGAKRCFSFSEELRKKGMDTEVISTCNFLPINTNNDVSDIAKMISQVRIYKKIRHERDSILFLQRVNYHVIAPLLVSGLYNNRIILDIDDWAMDANIFRGLSLIRKYNILNLFTYTCSKAFICTAISDKLVSFIKKYNNNVIYIPPLVSPVELVGKKYKNEFVFSWIGTIYRQDDVENVMKIVEAFNIVLNSYHNKVLYLDIIGGGSMFDSLKKIKNNNITIKNWIKYSDLSNYLSGIDAGLVPLFNNSKYNFYKTPTKLFDFMANGVPVITSDIGETGEFVNKHSIGLVAKNDAGSWARKMIEMVSEDARRERMSRNGHRLIAEDYSISNCVNVLYEILRKFK